MGGDTSPVNAPLSSQWQFCAPRPMAEPASASATTGSAVKGGHTTTSTPRGRLSPSRSDWASSRAWRAAPCIFQLPITSGTRIGSGVVERGDTGKLTALEELEERASGGRDGPDAGCDPRLLDGGDRVAATDDRIGSALADRLRHAQRTGRERLFLEHPHGTVPDDGLRARERRAELRDRGGTDVESRQVGGNVADRHRAEAARIV